MEVEGKVRKVMDVQTFDSGFRKRELIITTEEQYPQHLSIEFIQDKVDLLNGIKEDTPVRVSINLRGREWVSPEGVTRYFNTIQGWRVEKIDSSVPTAAIPADMPVVPPVDLGGKSFDDQEDDDLPF